MAKLMRRPLVHDSDANTHVPLVQGQYVDIEAIPVSSTEGNLLTTDEDGLYLSISGTVSEAADNQLTVQDGKLYVPASEQASVVSTDDGNLMRTGADNGAYIDGNDILSNGAVNLITINPVDGKIILTEDTLMEILCAAALVSSDDNNCIKTGSDGGLYVECSEQELGISSGAGITISESGAISVDTEWLSEYVESSVTSGTTYTAGDGITISDNNVILVDSSWLGKQIPEYQAGEGLTLSGYTFRLDADYVNENGNGGVSSDEGNALVAGSDAKAYFSCDLGVM